METSARPSYRLRPRYAALSYLAAGLGILFGIAALSFDFSQTGRDISWGVCLIGLGLALAYQLSPVRRLRIVVDDRGIEVRSRRRTRFRLAWGDVTEIIASPNTSTCYVNGGKTERSIVVPGVGAPAPYDIDNKRELYCRILEFAPASVVKYVELLETTPEPEQALGPSSEDRKR